VIGILSSDLDSESSPSLFDILTKTPIATSLAKITLHPLALGRSLQSSYALRLNLLASPQDPSVYTFLRNLYKRGWAGHGYRAAEADEWETNCTLDSLSSVKAGKRCLIEWDLRGVGKSKGATSEAGLAGLAAGASGLQVVMLGDVLPATRPKAAPAVSPVADPRSHLTPARPR
jgi:hypothetical protein